MEFYIWVKAIHILSFIAWMAVLFYMPRLFVYHRENIDNKGFVDVVKIQQQKLFKYIGQPAMAATVITGVIILMLVPSFLTGGGWMHAKITVVVLLLIFHFSMDVMRKKLEDGTCKRDGNFFRIYNEIPTILAIFIVILAVVKPF